jgi:D-3-phosphoglycerate dehydrogenase
MSTDGARFRIIVADGVSVSGLAPLVEDERFEVVDGKQWERDRLKKELADAHGLVVRSATKVDADLLEEANGLRVVGRAGVGVDNIDLEAATRRGIPVLNAPAGNTVSAAELTMALLLALARNVVPSDRSVRAGEWKRSRFSGFEIRGKGLGVLGAGRIGAEVVRRARAFGMRVLVYDPYLTQERVRELGVERLPLEEVLSRSDFVSLHLPLTPSTEGMIGSPQLSLMKPTAMIINVARGGIIDEGAVAAALKEGRLAGAAFDVYAEEPLAEDSPLRDAPNTILTPHLGASTREAQELVATEIAEAVRDAVLEGDLSRALNAPAIGGEALRRVRPLLGLGERLGRLACALLRGGIGKLELRYAGEQADALGPLMSSVLVGLLADVLGSHRVNLVNSRHLADSRGLRLTSSTLPRHPRYAEFLELVVESEGGTVEVAAAMLGHRHPRIVRIDDYALDIAPEGTLLILRNQDVPGVIGKVGSLIGSLGLNIAEYHQARHSPAGEALAAVTVDGSFPPEVLESLRGLPEVRDARLVSLD